MTSVVAARGVPAVLRRRATRLAGFRPTDLAGLLWAEKGLRRARRELDTVSVRLRLDEPGPAQRRVSLTALEAYLRLRRATCLERTLIVQRLLAAHDLRFDVVLGVRSVAGEVGAHAWIEGFDRPSASDGYREITRIGA